MNVLVIDVGTSSMRGILFDHHGGGRVTCPQGGKCFDFFFSGQWPWEASGLQVKGQKQKS